MKFETRYISCVSATFELSNKSIYFSETKYDVKVDGKIVLKDVNTNVFSIYNLEPNRDYVVSIDDYELKIHTLNVSLILHSKDFINESDKNDDTLALQTAINCLPKNGLLVIDEGEYHITTLFLKSDITVEIKKGAYLLGNTDIKAYPLFPGEVSYYEKDEKQQLGAWEGNPSIARTSVITAFYQENIHLVGEGVIDAQADKSDFWKDVKKLTWARPRILYFLNCKNIMVQGISVKNTPCWTIHPYFSSHIGFYDIKVSNPKDAPNTDGMDPEACDDVTILGVYFSVGDDCIALKSGKMYIGQTYKKPCSNVLIRNCMMHEGHGAIVLGSEIGAGVKDIVVERCYFDHTDRGLRIKTRRGRSKYSVVDGIHFKDIKMRNVLTPLVINMFYFCDPDGKTEYVWSKEKLPVDDRTPYLGSFVFENIDCEDAEYALGYFYGLPEQPIKSITIKNSSFSVKKDASKGKPAMMSFIDDYSKLGFYFNNVENVVMDNVVAKGYEGEEVILNNVTSYKKI